MPISPKTAELIRQLLGLVRPEIRDLARRLVRLLPSQLRHPIIGRIVGFLAQRIERMDLIGLQDSLADAVEIMSDEITKQVQNKAPKEKIDELEELKRMLENIRERLKRAENIEEEKNRIIAELQAYQSILEFFNTIEQKYVPEEKRKIEWEKIFKKLGDVINVVNEKGIQKAVEFIKEKYPEARREIKKQKREFLKGLKEGWQKGRKGSLI